MALNCSDITARNLISMLNGLGFDAEAICGILANWYHESSLKSNNLQNSYNTKLGMSDEQFTKAVETGEFDFYNSQLGFGYGLAQWTSKGRRKALYSFLKNRDRSIDDLQGQVDFFYDELKVSYKSTLDILMNPGKSVHEKCEAMLLNYEKPASVLKEETKQKTIGTRNATADEFYATYFRQTDVPKEENMAKVRIALNAGHYLYTSGKRVSKAFDPNETREWVLNDRIIDKLERRLASYDVEVIRLDDTTGATDTTLSKRASACNAFKPNISISMHHNAGVNGGSGGGIAVYFNSKKGTPVSLAKTLYNYLINAGCIKGNRSNPIQDQTSLYETNNSVAPYFLIENGFMDSSVDAKIIITDDYAERTVNGLMNFLEGSFGIKLKEGTVDTPAVEEPASSYVEYTVVSGDTLSKIASKFKTSVSAIVLLNNISDPNKIRVGQKLLIPVETVDKPAPTFKEGDIVKIKEGATWYNGKTIPSWVLKSTLYYRGSNSNGAIISTQKTGAITGVIKEVYLYK